MNRRKLLSILAGLPLVGGWAAKAQGLRIAPLPHDEPVGDGVALISRAHPSTVADWQPIETAPKARRILLWWVGRYSDEYPDSIRYPASTFGEISVVQPQGKAWSEGHYIPLDCYTHWAPLPSGPDPEPYASAGEDVTCENGHHVCTFLTDIRVGQMQDLPRQLGNWQQPAPEVGAFPIPGCAKCGAPFTDGTRFHIGDSWRTR